jgi:hypothetical protein
MPSSLYSDQTNSNAATLATETARQNGRVDMLLQLYTGVARIIDEYLSKILYPVLEALVKAIGLAKIGFSIFSVSVLT